LLLIPFQFFAYRRLQGVRLALAHLNAALVVLETLDTKGLGVGLNGVTKGKRDATNAEKLLTEALSRIQRASAMRVELDSELKLRSPPPPSLPPCVAPCRAQSQNNYHMLEVMHATAIFFVSTPALAPSCAGSTSWEIPVHAVCADSNAAFSSGIQISTGPS
jgi:hypothetical protein